MKKMSPDEVMSIEWNKVDHDALIGFCRRWNGEPALFRAILSRALDLVYLRQGELAEEVGVTSVKISQWTRGSSTPDETRMLLILSDVIQVRLEAFKARLEARKVVLVS